MLVIALLGLLVNVVAFAIIQSGDRANLNIRDAALHVMGDVLRSVAAVAAALCGPPHRRAPPRKAFRWARRPRHGRMVPNSSQRKVRDTRWVRKYSGD